MTINTKPLKVARSTKAQHSNHNNATKGNPPTFNLVWYTIEREEVEKCDTSRLIHDFTINIKGEIARSAMGRVFFSVSGYDNDASELYEIPEVVRFLHKAHDDGICWLYYTFLESNWLRVTRDSIYSSLCAESNGDSDEAIDRHLRQIVNEQFNRLGALWKISQPTTDIKLRYKELINYLQTRNA